jgi:hypothetical protein
MKHLLSSIREVLTGLNLLWLVTQMEQKTLYIVN